MNEENKKPENPQAFPQTWERDGNTDNWENGMTLRDYFANSAMQGICSDGHTFWDSHSMQGSPENIAKLSFEIADAMLKQREL